MTEEKAPYVVSIHEPADQRDHAVFRIFDRPIAFHRSFVTLTGSIAAALMLSQAMYWSQRTSDPAGWFYKTAAEWEQETGMTQREQDTARKRLRQFPWWQEDLRKANGAPTIHYRIDANEFQRSVEMDIAESAKSISRKARNGNQQKREMDIAESAKSLTETTTEITSETTTEITTAEIVADATATGPAQNSLEDSSDSKLSQNPTPPIVPPAQPEPTDWQKFVGALCWLCFGHDEVKALTQEQKGQLLAEAKKIKELGFTLDDLRLWYVQVWRNDWKYVKNGSRPTPAEVRSGIPSIRSKTPSGFVATVGGANNGKYAEDNPQNDPGYAHYTELREAGRNDEAQIYYREYARQKWGRVQPVRGDGLDGDGANQ